MTHSLTFNLGGVAKGYTADRMLESLAIAACVLGPDAAETLRKLPGVREVKIRTLQEPIASPRLERPPNR